MTNIEGMKQGWGKGLRSVMVASTNWGMVCSLNPFNHTKTCYDIHHIQIRKDSICAPCIEALCMINVYY